MTSIVLMACDIPVEVEVESAAFGEHLLDRFRGRVAPFAFDERLPPSRDMRVAVENGIATVDHHGLHGSIDLALGRIRTPSSIIFADALVRAAVAWRLAESDALLLHASGVLHDDRAVVLFGKSGVGKSTTARAFDQPLSDEMILLRRVEHEWLAEGTPWWNGGRARAPLGKLLWLVRGEPASVRPARASELLRALVAEAGRFFPEAGFQERLFGLCADLARRGALRLAAAEGRVVEAVREVLA